MSQNAQTHLKILAANAGIIHRVKSSEIFSTLAKCFNHYPLKLIEKVF